MIRWRGSGNQSTMWRILSGSAGIVLLAVGVTGCGASSGASTGTGGTAAGGTGGSMIGGSGGSSAAGTGGDSGGSTGTGGSGTGGAGTGGGSATPELITSAQNAYWMTGQVTTLTTGTADLSVDMTRTYQRWDGFGGCFNEMGWDALSVVPADQVTNAMKLLFDASAGANLAYGRISMGASGYEM